MAKLIVGNMKTLVNCVIGQMRSLESKCKTFQLSRKVDWIGLNWPKLTKIDQNIMQFNKHNNNNYYTSAFRRFGLETTAHYLCDIKIPSSWFLHLGSSSRV